MKLYHIPWIKPLILSPSSILCYVNWMLIVMSALVSFVCGAFNISTLTSLYCIVCYIGFAILGRCFLLHQPLLQQRAYIFGCLLLALSPRFFGSLNFDAFLYLYIAKSCFLLKRKSVIVVIITTGIASVLTYVSTLPITVQSTFDWSLNLEDPYQVLRSTVVHLCNYTMLTAFVISFSYLAIAEQRSRQQSEALAQQVESLAVSLERVRIAREIHDSLGHTLTSLQIQLVAAQRLRQKNLLKSFRATDIAKQLADQSIEDVSQAVQMMRQSEPFDLNQALNALMEQLKQKCGVSAQWHVQLPDLSLQINHQIYCLVKEGVTNIQKHAKASKVYLSGCQTDENILIELEDNGQGFNPQTLSKGFGLKGMQERVHLLRGQFLLNSAPGCGTKLQIRLPL